jgi:hypothetical protein
METVNSAAVLLMVHRRLEDGLDGSSEFRMRADLGKVEK